MRKIIIIILAVESFKNNIIIIIIVAKIIIGGITLALWFLIKPLYIIRRDNSLIRIFSKLLLLFLQFVASLIDVDHFLGG